MAEDDKKPRFNPLLNEGDMFKVVVWVAAACAVIVALALIAGAVF